MELIKSTSSRKTVLFLRPSDRILLQLMKYYYLIEMIVYNLLKNLCVRACYTLVNPRELADGEGLLLLGKTSSARSSPACLT